MFTWDIWVAYVTYKYKIERKSKQLYGKINYCNHISTYQRIHSKSAFLTIFSIWVFPTVFIVLNSSIARNNCSFIFIWFYFVIYNIYCICIMYIIAKNKTINFVQIQWDIKLCKHIICIDTIFNFWFNVNGIYINFIVIEISC